MACLSDEVLLSLVDGCLSEDELSDVDSHLDSCDTCRGVVAELSRTGEESPPLAAGAMVGRYRILDVLGRGAMGVVYAAFDPELDRSVALKLLRSELSERSRDQLISEARALAKLSHPNVVAVHDASSSAGDAFIAMEYVDGRTVGEWLADESPSWQQVRDVFVKAGRGLAAAHRAGLVHRDVKPDNVLVADDGQVKVGDFGLAVSDAHDGRSVGGTPAYMAPEQARGSAANALSDQYSFAASLFEALTGRRPRRGDTASQRSIEGVPRWLERAVLRALSAEPQDRFPGIAALVDTLDRKSRRPMFFAVGAGAAAAVAVAVALGVSANRDEPAPTCTGAAEQVGAVWGDARSRALVGEISSARSGFSSAAITSLVAALDQWRDGWIETHESVCRATHVDRSQSEQLLDVRMHCLARGLGRVDAQLDRVTRAGHGVVIAVPTVIAELPQPGDCRSLALTLAEPPSEQQAQAIEPLADRLDDAIASITVGDHRGAVGLLRDLVQEASKVGYAPFVAEVRLAQSRALRGVDDLPGAERVAREAAVTAQASRADRLVAEAWLQIASITAETGDLDAAVDALALAAASVERVGEPRDLAALLAEVSGLVRYNRGELEAAQTSFKRALRLYGEGARVGRTLAGLGTVARARGDLDGALTLHERAIKFDSDRFGADHPSVARDLHNRAGVLRLLEREDEALADYHRALAIKIAAFGPDHSDVALTRNSIALVYIDRNQFDEAVVELEQALTVLARVGSPERAGVLRNLGLIAERRGDRALARSRFEEARAVLGGAVAPGVLEADLNRVAAVTPRRRKPPARVPPPIVPKGPRRPPYIKSAPAKVDAGKPPPTSYMPDQGWK